MQHALMLGDEEHAARRGNEHRRDQGQFMTPAWLAEEILDRYFSHAGSRDAFLEPSCGIGRFLDAIALMHPQLPRFGIEKESELALEARNRGHDVAIADFLECNRSMIPFEPTIIIGNPPFDAHLIRAFIRRAHALLPMGGQLGFILPCYIFQAARQFERMRENWSISAEQIPRSIFRRLSIPLCFTLFEKDERRRIVGFAFYGSAAAIQRWHRRYRAIAIEGKQGRSVWRAVLEAAIADLGGEADLSLIYAAIEGKRPTDNKHWREKIRQQAQLHCRRVSRGRYALA